MQEIREVFRDFVAKALLILIGIYICAGVLVGLGRALGIEVLK